MRVSQLRQKHASTGFAQVRTSVKLVKQSGQKRTSLIFIQRRYLCILEQCCEANNVPQKCLGLCVEEEEDAAVVARSAFTSICDKFSSIVVRCTVEGGGIVVCFINMK